LIKRLIILIKHKHMTKKNLSLIFSLAIIALVFGCVLPAAASTEGAKGVCANINNLADKIGQRLVDSGEKIEKKKAERDSALAERHGNWDKKLADLRANWSEKHDKQLSKLEKRATTTTEKEAINTFKTTMTAALAARKAAIDKAISDFRAGLKEKLSARQNALDAAITAYKSAKEAAFAKAKADCSANIDSKVVLSTLKGSLKAAQDKFKADRQAIEKLGPDVKQLTAAKKEAIAKAVSDFKVIAEQARTALKTAFGIIK